MKDDLRELAKNFIGKSFAITYTNVEEMVRGRDYNEHVEVYINLSGYLREVNCGLFEDREWLKKPAMDWVHKKLEVYFKERIRNEIVKDILGDEENNI